MGVHAQVIAYYIMGFIDPFPEFYDLNLLSVLISCIIWYL